MFDEISLSEIKAYGKDSYLPFILLISNTGAPNSPTTLGFDVDTIILEPSPPSLSGPFTDAGIGNVENGKSGLSRCKLWESGRPSLLLMFLWSLHLIKTDF